MEDPFMTRFPDARRKWLFAAALVLALLLALVAWPWFTPRHGGELPTADAGLQVESVTTVVAGTSAGGTTEASVAKVRSPNGDESFAVRLKQGPEPGQTTTIPLPGGGAVEMTPLEGSGIVAPKKRVP
jgi:hypothetical protein